MKRHQKPIVLASSVLWSTTVFNSHLKLLHHDSWDIQSKTFNNCTIPSKDHHFQRRMILFFTWLQKSSIFFKNKTPILFTRLGKHSDHTNPMANLRLCLFTMPFFARNPRSKLVWDNYIPLFSCPRCQV